MNLLFIYILFIVASLTENGQSNNKATKYDDFVLANIW